MFTTPLFLGDLTHLLTHLHRLNRWDCCIPRDSIRFFLAGGSLGLEASINCEYLIVGGWNSLLKRAETLQVSVANICNLAASLFYDHKSGGWVISNKKEAPIISYEHTQAYRF